MVNENEDFPSFTFSTPQVKHQFVEKMTEFYGNHDAEFDEISTDIDFTYKVVDIFDDIYKAHGGQLIEYHEGYYYRHPEDTDSNYLVVINQNDLDFIDIAINHENYIKLHNYDTVII